jgi:hypothetical protein
LEDTTQHFNDLAYMKKTISTCMNNNKTDWSVKFVILASAFFVMTFAAPATSQSFSETWQEIAISELSGQIQNSPYKYLMDEWQIISPLLTGEESRASNESVYSIEELEVRLNTIKRGLQQSGAITETRWNTYCEALSSHLIKIIREQALAIFSYINDPNSAGIFVPAHKSTAEQLWISTRELDSPNNQPLAMDSVKLHIQQLTKIDVENKDVRLEGYLVSVQNRLSLFYACLKSRSQQSENSGPNGLVSTESIVGAVTECKLGMVSGWVYSPLAPDTPIAVTLNINGKRFALTANRRIDGVPQLTQINNVNHGFQFEFYAFNTGLNIIEVFATPPGSQSSVLLQRIELRVGS